LTITNPYAFAEGVEPVGAGPDAGYFSQLRAQYFTATIDTGVENYYPDSLATPGNPQDTGNSPNAVALTYAPPGSVDAPGLPGRPVAPVPGALDGSSESTVAPVTTPSLASGQG
jgi:hypothetical protein